MKTARFANMLVCQRRNRDRNGFILAETLIAVSIAVITLVAFLPLFVQIRLLSNTTARWEELSRQAMILDETIYHTLRVSKDITVTDKTIRCRDEKNTLTGFSVKNGRVYRFLGNGNEQPLTGASNAGIESEIYVSDTGEPYFSVKEDVIYARIILCDAVSGQSWPCDIAVTPLKGE